MDDPQPRRALRDALLPKLLSGELRVPAAELVDARMSAVFQSGHAWTAWTGWTAWAET